MLLFHRLTFHKVHTILKLIFLLCHLLKFGSGSYFRVNLGLFPVQGSKGDFCLIGQSIP